MPCAELLRAQVMRLLDQESVAPKPRVKGQRLTRLRPRRFWQGAFSGIGGTAIADAGPFDRCGVDR